MNIKSTLDPLLPLVCVVLLSLGCAEKSAPPSQSQTTGAGVNKAPESAKPAVTPEKVAKAQAADIPGSHLKMPPCCGLSKVPGLPGLHNHSKGVQLLPSGPTPASGLDAATVKKRAEEAKGTVPDQLVSAEDIKIGDAKGVLMHTKDSKIEKVVLVVNKNGQDHNIIVFYPLGAGFSEQALEMLRKASFHPEKVPVERGFTWDVKGLEETQGQVGSTVLKTQSGASMTLMPLAMLEVGSTDMLDKTVGDMMRGDPASEKLGEHKPYKQGLLEGVEQSFLLPTPNRKGRVALVHGENRTFLVVQLAPDGEAAKWWTTFDAVIASIRFP